MPENRVRLPAETDSILGEAGKISIFQGMTQFDEIFVWGERANMERAEDKVESSILQLLISLGKGPESLFTVMSVSDECSTYRGLKNVSRVTSYCLPSL